MSAAPCASTGTRSYSEADVLDYGSITTVDGYDNDLLLESERIRFLKEKEYRRVRRLHTSGHSVYNQTSGHSPFNIGSRKRWNVFSRLLKKNDILFEEYVTFYIEYTRALDRNYDDDCCIVL